METIKKGAASQSKNPTANRKAVNPKKNRPVIIVADLKVRPTNLIIILMTKLLKKDGCLEVSSFDNRRHGDIKVLSKISIEKKFQTNQRRLPEIFLKSEKARL
ncbi:MAG TPA: hypothetical protein VJI33_00350 [Candidatus Paceibacterota bacterium]